MELGRQVFFVLFCIAHMEVSILLLMELGRQAVFFRKNLETNGFDNFSPLFIL